MTRSDDPPNEKDLDFLPYTRQTIDDDDIAAVTDALRGDFLTTGPAVEEFEAELAAAVGAPHAIACSSGTAALHLAALALGIGPGDTVIVPAVTFVATANAARLAGAEVVFADVDADTGLMCVGHLEEALARCPAGARAVFPVHLGGQTADMAAIADVAAREGLSIVEDSCHALGTIAGEGNGAWTVGSCAHGDLATFSFHPAKTVAMGEGGAVTTRAPELAQRLRLFRNHGMTRDEGRFRNPAPGFWYYEQQVLGLNYRASDIHCALGTSQLRKLGQSAQRRSRLAKRYDAALADLAPVVWPVRRGPSTLTCWHLYQVLIDFDAIGMSRGALMERLRDRGIGTQVHYIPVPDQPYYRDRGVDAEFPGARAFYARCLSLPFFTGMADGDVDRVCRTLRDVIKGAES